ncbi:membrane-bound lytic murein transglycosylase MltF [Thioalkalivibrio sp. ALMg13-2]|uniref:membrane-bound lytic murein transglycosylase MltF n=1 Tax=Thioalkalivibrio sp. ALMg13-2 TaxID=1158167 RepID=UPI0003760E14|nr:membrane-bound lytic murein transglycosylase MltF [Thioalkalivibrio sp. ALMg13-2]
MTEQSKRKGRVTRSARCGRAFRALIPAALLALLAGCGSENGQPGTMVSNAAAGDRLASVDETGTLRVVTRNAPTTWYFDQHLETSGTEHDLVEGFALAHGWKVEWVMADSVSGVLEALESGAAHMAAAGLTHLPSRDERFRRGPHYMEVSEQVVCHRDLSGLPGSTDELEGVDLVVSAGSSYVETLEEALPESVDFEVREIGTERLMAQVARQEIGCTVADSHIVRYNRRSFPHLDIAFDLSAPRALGWYVDPEHAELAERAATWMQGAGGRELRDLVDERYYAYINQFDFVDLRALNRRIEDRLPQYHPHFEEAAERTDLPADLLAALAYQESHWDPEARSPTGVRGLMMLTRRTAESLGVDRLDPVESIDGGARYLQRQHGLLPDDIVEPDRTYLALAAYNIGRGHLLDARRLARELGRDPDRWADMREILPLLTEERYYKDLRYGYARGYQPVYYVQRIRNYRDVIRPVFVAEDEMSDRVVVSRD